MSFQVIQYLTLTLTFIIPFSIAHIVQTQKSQSEGLIGPVV